MGKTIIRFARRHRGRVTFYATGLVALLLHKSGATGIGVGIFVIMALTMAQEIDSNSATGGAHVG